MQMPKKRKGLNLLKPLPVLSDPGVARTLDPLIKSQLLYQLSYGVAPVFRSANIPAFGL